MIQISCDVCSLQVNKKPNDYFKASMHFCSHRCRAIYYNRLRSTRVVNVCTRTGCNNRISNGSKWKKYCSVGCANLDRKTKYSKNKVINLIKTFSDKHGRIPTKAEMQNIYRVARKYFGTWNKAIINSGYTPNPVIFAKHYLAKDGHKCDSLAEKIIDDWLYYRNIPHKIHLTYPWDNGMKCDFFVYPYWIELFGLKGQLKSYDLLVGKKLKLIAKYKLRLIKLTLKDVYQNNLNNKLNCLVGRQHRPN